MRIRVLLTVSVLGLLLVSVASADTLIATNLRAGADLSASGGSFTGSVTFTNSSSVNQGLIAFSLELLEGGGVISNLHVTGLPSGWHYYDGKQSNSGAPCNQTGNENWFCADGFSSGGHLPFTMGSIPANSSITFNFSGMYTGIPVVGDLDLMANGCTTTSFTTTGKNTVSCRDDKWAYSANVGTSTPTPPVPEPASLMLFGSGVGLLGTYLRRRK